MGVRMEIGVDTIDVYGTENLKGVDIVTKPYPGFATDLQQPLTVLMTQAQGESHVRDTLYPERFKHCQELEKMGAVIEVSGGEAEIRPYSIRWCGSAGIRSAMWSSYGCGWSDRKRCNNDFQCISY